MPKVKFGLLWSPSTPYIELRAAALYFENCGVDSIWMSDHMLKTFKPDAPYRDSVTLLSALAEVTSKAYIGNLVMSNTFRHPAVLVRQLLALDEISRGRLIVGIGAGWYQAEHQIFGIPYPKAPIAKLNSALEIITRLLRNEATPYLEVPGYLPIQHAIVRPRPIGPCPIMVGGHGQKVIETAAAYADMWNSFGTPNEMRERVDYLNKCLEGHSLPHSAVEKSLYVWNGMLPWGDPFSSIEAFEQTLDEYSHCGLDGIIFDAPKLHQMETFHKCKLLMTTWNPAST